jgi:hypothetical protein
MPSRRNRVNQLSLGVMARSLKENERRLPLHPHHLDRIPDDLRDSVYLERRYGERFGMAGAGQPCRGQVADADAGAHGGGEQAENEGDRGGQFGVLQPV